LWISKKREFSYSALTFSADVDSALTFSVGIDSALTVSVGVDSAEVGRGS